MRDRRSDGSMIGRDGKHEPNPISADSNLARFGLELVYRNVGSMRRKGRCKDRSGCETLVSLKLGRTRKRAWIGRFMAEQPITTEKVRTSPPPQLLLHPETEWQYERETRDEEETMKQTLPRYVAESQSHGVVACRGSQRKSDWNFSPLAGSPASPAK